MEGTRPYTPTEPRPEDSHGTRKLIGIVLIGLGVIAALFILQTIYNVITGPQEFPLVERIAGEAPVITTPDGDITLPESLLVLGAYAVLILLIAIASGIAQGFIRIGVQLFQTDPRTRLRELREEMAQLAATLPPNQPGPGRPPHG